jgi:hypothetical protein
MQIASKPSEGVRVKTMLTEKPKTKILVDGVDPKETLRHVSSSIPLGMGCR